MQADIILKNGRVITMDAALPRAEAVAIAGEKITAVGSNADLDTLTAARIIDCTGKTVVPGFHDAHLHFFSLVRKLLSIDLSPAAVGSIAEIKEAIRRRAEKTPPGTWLSGTDYNEFYLAEGRCPTRWDLDEAAPDHPVILSHRSLHACVLNSLALSLAGIDSDTPEPPGTRIERDLETGEPNGILVEMLAYIRTEIMPTLTEAELTEGIVLANRELISHGITSLQDATYKNDPARWEIVRKCQESGELNSRITLMMGPDTRHDFREAGITPEIGNNRLRLGAVKIMLGESAGQDDYSQGELNALVLDCHRAGQQVAFHAIQESSIVQAVTALEYANAFSPVARRRHRIEHCSECPPYLLKRLEKLGAVIVTQPATVYYNGERYLATVPVEQQPWLYHIRSPLESGVLVAGSSDAPVIPLDPLKGIYAAVTRRAESGQFLLPEEAITPETALVLYTRNAAYTAFEEEIKGAISPGQLADIVVLSDDPTRVSPEEIKDIEVEMTIIGGGVVWER